MLTLQGPRDARQALHFQVHTVPFGRHDSSTVGDRHLGRQGKTVRPSRTVAAGAPLGRAVRENGPRVPGPERAGQGNRVVVSKSFTTRRRSRAFQGLACPSEGLSVLKTVT